MAETESKTNGKHRLDDDEEVPTKAKLLKGESNGKNGVNNVIKSKTKEDDTVGSTTDDGNSKDEFNEQSNDAKESYDSNEDDDVDEDYDDEDDGDEVDENTVDDDDDDDDDEDDDDDDDDDGEDDETTADKGDFEGTADGATNDDE